MELPHELLRAWGLHTTAWTGLFAILTFTAWFDAVISSHRSSLAIRYAWLGSSIAFSLAAVSFGTLTWLYW